MRAWDMARCTVMVLVMLVVLASDAARSNPDALHFVHVTGPEGQEIEINVTEISSIRRPRRNSKGHFAEGVKCVIYMTNGHFIPSSETCKDIVNKIGALDEKPKTDH